MNKFSYSAPLMAGLLATNLLAAGLLTARAGSQQQATPASAPAAQKQAQPTPDARTNLIGKPLAAWNISAQHWTNTRKPIHLEDLKGHVTVIEFFRIGCSHCRDAAPARRALYRKYRSRGLKMIGFQSPGDTANTRNSENNWRQVKSQIRQWHLTYPIAFDRNRALFDSYNLQFYPTVLVVDRKGIVRFQQTGFTPTNAKALEQFVAGALKK